MKFGFYCRCGAAAHGVAPERGVKEIERAFWSVHQGEGCGPCDAKTARQARRREEARADRMMKQSIEERSAKPW